MFHSIKDFVWFTKNSWSYLQGNRKAYFTGFFPAWRKFHASSKQDRQT